MKCCVCNKEIKPGEKYKPFGCDGNFIHSDCKPILEKGMEIIKNMSDEEFANWIQGM